LLAVELFVVAHIEELLSCVYSIYYKLFI
jgi:hypothetical protein